MKWPRARGPGSPAGNEGCILRSPSRVPTLAWVPRMNPSCIGVLTRYMMSFYEAFEESALGTTEACPLGNEVRAQRRAAKNTGSSQF